MRIRDLSILALFLVSSFAFAGEEKLGLTTGFTPEHEGVWYDENRTGVYAAVTVSPRAYGNRVILFLNLDRVPNSPTALAATADFVSAPGAHLVDETLRTNANRMGVASTPYASTAVGSIRVIAQCFKGRPRIDALVRVNGIAQPYQFTPFMGVDPFLCQ